MANINLSNITYRSILVNISFLQYPANDYDYFNFKFYQNGILILDVKHVSSSSYTTFTIEFDNTDYLGYNWFTPNTSYNIVVTGTLNGSTYSIGSDTFITSTVSPPSGTITPSVYTKIKEQTYETCVPMSLSTAMDRFRAIKVGSDYENYSVSYIFGDGYGYSWGMGFKDAVVACKSHGSPRWDLVSTSFGADEKNITSSVLTFNNADNYAVSNALLQKFSGYINIDFYDCASVANAIQNYGYFMFNFRIPNNFYNIGSDGIVPQPDTYANVNHSLSLIGLTIKNGKPHWIAQNSWGTYWGVNGICFIPWDWGIGVLAPTRGGSDPTSWTLDSYSVYNNSVSNYIPDVPTNVTAIKTSALTANILWDTTLTGALYTIFARKYYDNKWYIKGRTTNTSLNITFDSYDTYKIRVLSTINNLYSDYSNEAMLDLLNRLPTPTLDSSATIKTANSIQVTINEIIGYQNIQYVCFLYLGVNMVSSKTSTTTRTFLFTGLSSNTEYRIEIKCNNVTGYDDSLTNIYYATTLANSFVWSTVERTAFENQGYLNVLTYLRWNEFVNKVKNIIDSINGNWVIDSTQGATLTYTQTLMISTDKVLTAARFNSVRFNIGSRMPTGINKVYTNDDILGSYFIILETKLNEWTASL